MEDFLFYAMRDNKISSFIKQQAFGCSMPALSFKIMDMVEIYLPTIQEQKELVLKIQEEEKAIEECKKLIEIYKQKINDKIQSIWGKV